MRRTHSYSLTTWTRPSLSTRSRNQVRLWGQRWELSALIDRSTSPTDGLLPFFELEQRLAAERVELLLWPAAWVVEHEARGLAVQFFLLEDLCDAHRLDRTTGRVREEKVEADPLQGGHAELVSDVHQTLHVVPRDGVFHAMLWVNTVRPFGTFRVG